MRIKNWLIPSGLELRVGNSLEKQILQCSVSRCEMLQLVFMRMPNNWFTVKIGLL